MKSRLLSPSSFLRMPLIAWNAPPAIISDMSGVELLGLFAALPIGGTPATHVLYPDRSGRAALRRRRPDRLRSLPPRGGRPLHGRVSRRRVPYWEPELPAATVFESFEEEPSLAAADLEEPSLDSPVDFEELSEEELSPLLGGVAFAARATALALAVVGVVEALALEVNGGGVEHAFDRHARLRVGRQRVVAEGLLYLERRPVGAPVLIDRHRPPIIGALSGALRRVNRSATRAHR